MRSFGYYWGIAGVIGILLYAIVRLSAKVVEMLSYSLTPWQWTVLVAFALYMAYAEGYKGFHRNFAPRVVVRAGLFRDGGGRRHQRLVPVAPLVCMGYIHATRKRKLVSFALTSAIIVLVILVGMTPQPWRGIIDAGVVLGLCIGLGSIVYFWIRAERGLGGDTVPADFPD